MCLQMIGFRVICSEEEMARDTELAKPTNGLVEERECRVLLLKIMFLYNIYIQNFADLFIVVVLSNKYHL